MNGAKRLGEAIICLAVFSSCGISSDRTFIEIQGAAQALRCKTPAKFCS